METRIIDAAHGADVRLPNEPFDIWGRMIPALKDGAWSYTTEKFDTQTTLCFPDEPYDVSDETAVFIGAYDEGRCVGLAVLRPDMFKYMYLDDLKVNADMRGRGVGGMLIEACMAEAKRRGMLGVYTIGQDDNLSACLFYIKQGFEIGGFDNRVYRGTSQEDKSNIYFYRDCE